MNQTESKFVPNSLKALPQKAVIIFGLNLFYFLPKRCSLKTIWFVLHKLVNWLLLIEGFKVGIETHVEQFVQVKHEAVSSPLN